MLNRQRTLVKGSVAVARNELWREKWYEKVDLCSNSGRKATPQYVNIFIAVHVLCVKILNEFIYWLNPGLDLDVLDVL